MVLEYQILRKILHQQYQLIQQVDLVLCLIQVQVLDADTVGHGLGVAPSMIILKRRDALDNWYVITIVIN
jgi:hypothetical protein